MLKDMLLPDNAASVLLNIPTRKLKLLLIGVLVFIVLPFSDAFFIFDEAISNFSYEHLSNVRRIQWSPVNESLFSNVSF